MSLRLSAQSKMSVMPARLAARIFSLIPPTGSTLPRSVISPVIAIFERTLRCVKSEAIDVTIVTPADGPSLGIAPSGTWIWISYFSNNSELMPNWKPLALRYWIAIIADSFITSPRLPVSVSLSPLPFEIDDSMKSMSPPTCVQARPVTTPA